MNILLRGYNGLKRRITKSIRKTYNTFYYWKNRNNILIINCSYLQWGDRLISRNFGDDLNYILFKELTGKQILNLDEFFHCTTVDSIMGIGSILDWKINGNSIIWGSGVLHSEKVIPLYSRPKEVLSVRGKLTQEYLLKQGIKCPSVFGDPALLMPIIYKSRHFQTSKIGIIPHYVDLEDPKLHEFLHNREDVVIINVRDYNNWHDVIDSICSCCCIISSSLHGLILSDAYKIPNIWVKFSNQIKGNDFKYYDYFSSVGRNDTPVNFDDISIDQIHNKINNYRPIYYNVHKIMNIFPFQLVDKFSYLRCQDVFIGESPYNNLNNN